MKVVIGERCITSRWRTLSLPWSC